jgi:hypothetical protein
MQVRGSSASGGQFTVGEDYSYDVERHPPALRTTPRGQHKGRLGLTTGKQPGLPRGQVGQW